MRTFAAAALLTVMIAPALAMPAAARGLDLFYRDPPHPDRGWVTAYSRWGNGSIRARVRPTWYGHEVQLRSGRWSDCEGRCAETLRRWELDFWEVQSFEHGGTR